MAYDVMATVCPGQRRGKTRERLAVCTTSKNAPTLLEAAAIDTVSAAASLSTTRVSAGFAEIVMFWLATM